MGQVTNIDDIKVEVTLQGQRHVYNISSEEYANGLMKIPDDELLDVTVGAMIQVMEDFIDNKAAIWAQFNRRGVWLLLKEIDRRKEAGNGHE